LVNTPDTERYRATSTGSSKNMVVIKIAMVVTSVEFGARTETSER
jgi:hypothetical protein